MVAVACPAGYASLMRFFFILGAGVLKSSGPCKIARLEAVAANAEFAITEFKI